MYKSNYDKYPATPMEGIVWKGWENICNQLKSSLSAESCVLVINAIRESFTTSCATDLQACMPIAGSIHKVYSNR